MSQQLPPGQDDQEIQALANLVAENLAKGEDPAKIAEQLVDSGWEVDDAHGFVGSIQSQLAASASASDGEGGGMGWLVWIGGLLLINFLSYVFNWGFWIY